LKKTFDKKEKVNIIASLTQYKNPLLNNTQGRLGGHYNFGYIELTPAQSPFSITTAE